MDHGLELIIPSLEILEIEVFNILYNPGNIGKLIFQMFNWILIDSVPKMILYGPRIRIVYSWPANIGN